MLDGLDQRELIEQVGLQQRDAIEQVLDAPHVRRAQAADDAEHFVVFFEQQLGEIGAVLAGDARDQCAFLRRHKLNSIYEGHVGGRSRASASTDSLEPARCVSTSRPSSGNPKY